VTISDQPEREPETASGETVLDETTVTVRRSPRIVNFMILGAVLGALVAVLLTYAFPENDRFSRTQVMGFLLLACVAAGVALASLVALILGRIVSRKAVTVVADRMSASPPDPGTPVSLTTLDADPTAPTSGTPAPATSPSGIPASGASPSGTSTSGTSSSGTTLPDAEPSGSTHPGSTSSSTTSENSK
jgi:hypothetical protein